ncbi:hypothetical protein PoB_005460900 [Plakobranchus ocellatus]|uniref:Uncharacterized protein n=1 Tax=Plakobranchus ocellatus TaxID=259542 RepID=A0AAV4CAM2_9GAST|nr:hypothetical protein PoB_005460900 [Plakobranchus ocellatus]
MKKQTAVGLDICGRRDVSDEDIHIWIGVTVGIANATANTAATACAVTASSASATAAVVAAAAAATDISTAAAGMVLLMLSLPPLQLPLTLELNLLVSVWLSADGRANLRRRVPIGFRLISLSTAPHYCHGFAKILPLYTRSPLGGIPSRGPQTENATSHNGSLLLTRYPRR